MAHRVTRLAVAATLAASALLAGCKSDTPESLLADAKQQLAKGDRKAAQIQLKNALSKDPNSGEARFELARLSLEMNDPVSAEKEARRALDLKYKPQESQRLLADALLRMGDFQKMLDDTDKFERTPALLALRGEALIGLRKLDEAKKEFQVALDAQPNSADALTGMARLAAIGNDLEGARALADQAIAKDASNINALTFKGELLRAQEKPEEARAAFAEVLKLDPTNSSANLEQAYLDIVAGKLDAAQAAVNQAKKSAPRSLPTLYTQSLIDYSRGNYKAARDNLQLLAKSAPNHLPSMLLSASVDYHLDNLHAGEAKLRTYLDAMPGNVYARKMLAATLLRESQPAEALTVLEPALQDKVSDGSLLELAAQGNMMVREPGKAAALLERAIAINPKRSPTYIALGGARIALGEREQGMAMLNKALELEPDSLTAALALARARLGVGEFDQAMAVLAKQEAKHGKEAELHILKGHVLLAKKDKAGARAAFNKAVELAPASYAAVITLVQLELMEQKPEAARAHLQKLLERDKGNVLAMTAMAQLAERAKKRDEATQWLEKAAAVNTDALAPALRLGGYYLQTRQPNKAVDYLRNVLVIHPDSPIVLELMGRAQQMSGDLPGADETFSKLAGALPKAPQPQLFLASVKVQRKDLAGAQASVKKALALAPGFIPAYLMQADLALLQNKPEEALAVARGLQKSQPKQVAGYVMEAELLVKTGKPAQAVTPYQQAFAMEQRPELLMKLASALRAANRSAEADAQVAAWRKAHPDEPLGMLYSAELNIAAKQYKQAIAQLEAVLGKTPDNVMALNNLAWSYQQEKDKRALPTAEKASQLAGDNPTVMDTLGWILAEQNQLERALPFLKKASELAPQASDIRGHYAAALWKKGDKAGARKELQAAMADARFAQSDEGRNLQKQFE
ncbi:PEP-CTERM system TPR-repeat protein PrsT [Pseudoduganella eburnea]|uniref:PEP-CTERM system TPR-repeat protein PrsT n=1 Tax=Massilia eburnea TaxID=1776165 RepID=A0A6L6QPL8_9BURK|nr:XrtA/PEP-CTERM system TPR-repeat protein PrsT [Massilia eburnea]MTW14348.1 PEP-CTERM system TPR-repeat protein PrsT [Massilia eburnea]